ISTARGCCPRTGPTRRRCVRDERRCADSHRGRVVIYDLLIHPLLDFAFMRRALVACLALSVSAGPIGVFLVLRRMSLMGDAMSHAILPGAAVGFLLSGLSLWAMSVGGLVAALAVGLLARA